MLSIYKVIELGNEGDGKWLKIVRIVNRAVALWDYDFCFATLCNNQQRNELQSSRSGSKKKVPFPCSSEKDKMIRTRNALGIRQINTLDQ